MRATAVAAKLSGVRLLLFLKWMLIRMVDLGTYLVVPPLAKRIFSESNITGWKLCGYHTPSDHTRLSTATPDNHLLVGPCVLALNKEQQ